MVYTYSIQGKDKFKEAVKISKEEGLKSLFIKLFLYFIYPQLRYALMMFSSIIIFFKPKRFFYFQGKKLFYFYHRYNTTWNNERVIEVPIITNYIKSFFKKRILEVGAVLTHYYSPKWDILDKFEKGKKIINKDIINFKPIKKYDLIISISTLEHVGFDEEIKDSKKIIKAIKNLKQNCLAPKGKCIITMPIGYNLETDKLLFANKLGFKEKIFLKRINKKNEWVEVPEEVAKSTTYNKPFNAANSIVIGIIKK